MKREKDMKNVKIGQKSDGGNSDGIFNNNRDV